MLWLGAGALLFAAGWWARPGPNTPTIGPAELAGLRGEVAALGAALDAERADRLALADEVAALRGDLSALASRGLGEASGAASAGAGVSAAGAGPGAKPGAGATAASFDEAAMLAAGFDPEVVRQIRARFDEIDLERLYLRDQSTREGWFGTPRFIKEIEDLNEALHSASEEFGPDVYDWMLYASGRPNAVAVMGVIEGSAAAYAGLEPGDVIVGYGDQRIYGVEELRKETLLGDPGETTPVDILSKGTPRRVNLPRGPIGIRMVPTSVRPKPER